jgi:hypothetical protein
MVSYEDEFVAGFAGCSEQRPAQQCAQREPAFRFDFRGRR